MKKNKVLKIAQNARKAALFMAKIPTKEKNRALRLMAKMLRENQDFLMRANQKDLQQARGRGYAKALIDRLTLTSGRIKAMSSCLLDTVSLDDPVGKILESFRRPNGLFVQKIRVPIGVIGVIYESRPNVTSDCAGLCLKSGNAVILKGGKEAQYSNAAIFKILRQAISRTRIPLDTICLIPSTDRLAVQDLLKLDHYVDVIIPRGGEGLIRFVAENSCVPVIKHYKGVCHTYVSAHADLKTAHRVCYNAKVQRPGVCNAMETLLVHKKIAKRFLPAMIDSLREAGVELRGCAQTRRIAPKKVKQAHRADWSEEYLDLVLSIKVVENTQEAIAHINTYGSKHSDAIITSQKREAQDFLRAVDSACLYVNASTRFTDGNEFGFGAEVGVSTDKLHARGPMGLRELTTYKYQIFGKGQIRR